MYISVFMNKFACLSTNDDQAPHMQATDQQHQLNANLSQGLTIDSVNTCGLITGSLKSKAHDVCNFMSKQVDIGAVQEIWCGLGDCDMRALIMKEGLWDTGVNGYNTTTRMGGGTGFISTESITQNITQLHGHAQHNERTTWTMLKPRCRKD